MGLQWGATSAHQGGAYLANKGAYIPTKEPKGGAYLTKLYGYNLQWGATSAQQGGAYSANKGAYSANIGAKGGSLISQQRINRSLLNQIIMGLQWGLTFSQVVWLIGC